MNMSQTVKIKRLIGKRVWFKANKALELPREICRIDAIANDKEVFITDDNDGGGTALISDIEYVNGKPNVVQEYNQGFVANI